MVYHNVKGYIWGITQYIGEEGICYQYLLTRVVLDDDIIVLQGEQHSLEVDWFIYQVIQLDLLKGLEVTLDSEFMTKNICVELFSTQGTGKHLMLYVGIVLFCRC